MFTQWLTVLFQRQSSWLAVPMHEGHQTSRTISKVATMSRAAILKIRKLILIVWAVLIVTAMSSRAQIDSDASNVAPARTTASGADDIIPFLNQTIVWSRQLSGQQQLVREATDAMFFNDSRQVADQVVRLAFEFARARAQALSNDSEAGLSHP